MLSRSASALPAHASSAHGASRATNIYISLVANSASNLVGAAIGEWLQKNAVFLIPLAYTRTPHACKGLQGRFWRVFLKGHARCNVTSCFLGSFSYLISFCMLRRFEHHMNLSHYMVPVSECPPLMWEDTLTGRFEGLSDLEWQLFADLFPAPLKRGAGNATDPISRGGEYLIPSNYPWHPYYDLISASRSRWTFSSDGRLNDGNARHSPNT